MTRNTPFGAPGTMMSGQASCEHSEWMVCAAKHQLNISAGRKYSAAARPDRDDIG